MLLMFYLTFGVVGNWLSDLLSLGIDALTGVGGRGADGLRHQPRGALA